MEQSLRIIADTPSGSPGLGFQSYAEALAAAIRGGTPPQFTIGIYGAWGSGKSSLLNAIAGQLKTDDRVLPVLFDAWRFERADHIVVPLLHAIHTAIPALEDKKVSEKVRRALISVVNGLSFNLGVVGFDAGKASEAISEGSATTSLHQLDAAYVRPYADMRAIGDALAGRRIAVLVDDLDRCSPANVVALLEAINLVMDVPGFVFVLALDYQVLVNAVAAKYPHTSGHVFIEKMVQVPFRVPRLSLQKESFLAELIPEWSTHEASLPAEFSGIAYDICTLGLDANPRQIKRFINSVYVLSRVAEKTLLEIDIEMLAGVVGLQLRWPAEYQDLANAVFSGDSQPEETLLKADHPGLARYAERFFGSSAAMENLSNVLHLTQTVGGTETASGYETGEYDTLESGAPRLREVHREEIEGQLSALGFEVSPRYPGTFYHAGGSGCRVKFGKTVVRLECKGKEGRWIIAKSFLLTREHKNALALLADVEKLQEITSAAARLDTVGLAQWMRRKGFGTG